MSCFANRFLVSFLGLAFLGGCSVSGNNSVSFDPDAANNDVVMKHGWTPGFERQVNAFARPSQARNEPVMADPRPDEAALERNWPVSLYDYPTPAVVAFPTYNLNYEDRPRWLQNDNLYALMQPVIVMADVVAMPFWILIEPPSTQVVYRGDTHYAPSMTVAPPLPNN